ncbi:hypothetical protein COY43_00845, partial [Candidatus Berkelbacteria bacterium CG_4_10_14_0_8_um_filter_35_9_33_8]
MEFLKKLLKISLLFGVATLSFLFTNFNQPEKVQAQTCPTSEQVILSVSATPTTVNKGEKLTDSVKM